MDLAAEELTAEALDQTYKMRECISDFSVAHGVFWLVEVGADGRFRAQFAGTEIRICAPFLTR